MFSLVCEGIVIDLGVKIKQFLFCFVFALKIRVQTTLETVCSVLDFTVMRNINRIMNFLLLLAESLCFLITKKDILMKHFKHLAILK